MINAKELAVSLLDGRYDDWLLSIYYCEYGTQEMAEHFGKNWEMRGTAKPQTYYLFCYPEVGQKLPEDFDADFDIISEEGVVCYVSEMY